MRIAFIMGSLQMGGIDKVTVHVANELINYCEIDLITMGKNGEFYKVDSRINIIEANISYNLYNRIVRKVKNFMKKDFKNCYFKEIKYVGSLVGKSHYDRIITVDGMHTMILDVVRQSGENDIKYISWLHNNYNTYFNNYYKDFKDNLASALSNAETVVALTKEDRKMYARYNKNTLNIYNPVTIKKTEVTNLQSKEILFVARLVKGQKGLDYLIEIIKKLKGYGLKIRIVGDGADYNWLKSSIKEHSIEDMVILHGAVKDNIHEIYANASIFISTSRWEGFGLVITEAMACGLPVVAFENSGPTEILDNGKYGILVPKYDVDKFAQAIIRLIENPNELEYYSCKSLERANDFSTSKIVKQWKQIIENSD